MCVYVCDSDVINTSIVGLVARGGEHGDWAARLDMSEVVLWLANDTTDPTSILSILAHSTADNSSTLLLHEYGGGIIVFASFTILQIKLEPNESSVLACESDLK